MLLLYVDVIFLTGEDKFIKDTSMILSIEFKMKDLWMIHYFLGIEVWQNADGIFLDQGKYAVEILKKFETLDLKAIATPMASNLKQLCDASLETVDSTMYCQMICSLMCLMITRPDI